jgi:hypothetical protein
MRPENGEQEIQKREETEVLGEAHSSAKGGR